MLSHLGGIFFYGIIYFKWREIFDNMADLGGRACMIEVYEEMIR